VTSLAHGRRRAAAALAALAALAAAGAAALAAARLAAAAGLEPMRVRGESMRPTLRPGQRIAVGPLGGPPPRGAVVVLRHPADDRFELVKRVVGLPGERLRVVGGTIEVDGRPLPEPYLAPRQESRGVPALEVVLGAGEYLVLGDRRDGSTDGRAFGPVHAEHLVGLVRFAYWPPRRLRLRSG
jgi:signal peptidase I